ncbi:uncharacterized protein LOC135388396 [Ornithodoros turicata]|uniref:uncharacterized protein LOC135388396 n=1 Tax=Ornithodoros turicata TaxID=34597 RepID=UPI0031392233
MGSPVSVTLANLVMEHVEESALEQAPCPIKFYRRYVDDTFVILSRVLVDAFHSVLNSVEPSIQFTYEIEKNNVLPFLDVNVHHDQVRQIKTTVYRKACDTGNFLDFNSHHPTEHKRAVIRTLLDRAERLASDSQLQSSEETTVNELLRKRGYPQRFIDDTRRRREDRQPKEPSTHNGTISIPYVKGVSERIRRILLPLGIKTCFKPHMKLRHIISRPKDPTPPGSESGVVYRLCCLECNATYVGETGRKRDTRVKEHRRDVEKATNATRSKTELVDHCWTTGHVFDYKGAVTLAREQRWGPRKFLESWHIQREPIACNANRGPLPGLYSCLGKPVNSKTGFSAPHSRP